MKKQILRYRVICILIAAVLCLIISNTGMYMYATQKASKATKENLYEKHVENLAEQKEEKAAEKVRQWEEREKNASVKLNAEKMKDIEHVMIVAHPDDETLWGGSHILQGKYLIVTITNGNNRTRMKEFKKATDYTEDYGVMLKYPDNPNKVKNDWSSVKEDIRKDLAYILNYKEYTSIITHNPEGEYGHIQHKFTSMLVSEACLKSDLTDKLSYFGKYYSLKEINAGLQKAQPLSWEIIEQKEHIMDTCYSSQGHAHKIFDHMIPYESFVAYDEWCYRK